MSRRKAADAMEEDETKEEISTPEEQAPDETEGNSMYVAVISSTGTVQDVTPISTEALSAVQETLKNFQIPRPVRRARRITPFPAVTSQHITPLPGTESFLVLSGSFGSNVTKQPTLWSDGQGFDLTTPTGKLRVEGQTTVENTSLQHYVASEIGPEGIKELACLIDVYDLLAGGQDQNQNVEVTAKQLLQRMGKADHADDDEEQAHLVNTTLYLARTFVISISARQTRVSPLLVLESVTTDQYGTIRLRYHLGEDTFESIYGPKPVLYPLPTPLIMGYHGAKSHHEILLTVYLGNRLAQGRSHSLYFVTLCTHSGLLTREKLLPSQKNRMRDAQQVIAALLQFERDEFIRCEAHPDLDMVLAVNATLDPAFADTLALQTLERLEPLLRTLEGYHKLELMQKRRFALQRLLDVDASREERETENPEFCTRLTIAPGAQFLAKQQQLLAKQRESASKEG